MGTRSFWFALRPVLMTSMACMQQKESSPPEANGHHSLEVVLNSFKSNLSDTYKQAARCLLALYANHESRLPFQVV